MKIPRQLKHGSRGRDVKAMQRGLWRAGFRKADKGNIEAPEMGDFTVAQLKEFQLANGIPATGYLGQATFDKLLPFYDERALKLVKGVAEDLAKPDLTDRQKVVNAAFVGYLKRYNIFYTQGSARWTGIDDKVMPPNYPRWADCSSYVTWCYWTVFKNGRDFINGANWRAGFTGTQINHGQLVSRSNLRPGDLVFYGRSNSHISHVAMYVGNGNVISHGSSRGPEQRYINYRHDLRQCRSYI